MAALTPSPFAPERFPDLPAVRGVRLAGGAAGVRASYKGRADLMIAAIAAGSSPTDSCTRPARIC